MRSTYLALAAITAGIAIVSIGSGLVGNYVPLRLNLAQTPTPIIGIVTTGYPLGFLVGCLTAPWIIRRVGHIRAFAILSTLTATGCLALAIDVEPAMWTVIRTLTGFTSAGLFVIAESWMNEQAPNEQRGRIFGAYMVVTKLAYGGGQLLLMAADPMSLAPYMMIAACYSLCLVPVAFTNAPSPRPPERAALNLPWLWRLSPVGVMACIVAGICNTSIVSIGPVYAADLGYDIKDIAIFTATIQFGIMVFQYPIGFISDRFDRRTVLIGVAATTALVGLAIALAGHKSFWILLGLSFVYGGVSGTVYTLGVAHAADRADKSQLVAMSGGLLLAWALGSILGPVLATSTMAKLGPAGLFFFTIVITGLLIPFVLFRMKRREPAQQEPQAHVGAPVPTAPGLDAAVAKEQDE